MSRPANFFFPSREPGLREGGALGATNFRANQKPSRPAKLKLFEKLQDRPFSRRVAKATISTSRLPHEFRELGRAPCSCFTPRSSPSQPQQWPLRVGSWRAPAPASCDPPPLLDHPHKRSECHAPRGGTTQPRPRPSTLRLPTLSTRSAS